MTTSMTLVLYPAFGRESEFRFRQSLLESRRARPVLYDEIRNGQQPQLLTDFGRELLAALRHNDDLSFDLHPRKVMLRLHTAFDLGNKLWKILRSLRTFTADKDVELVITTADDKYISRTLLNPDQELFLSCIDAAVEALQEQSSSNIEDPVLERLDRISGQLERLIDAVEKLASRR